MSQVDAKQFKNLPGATPGTGMAQLDAKQVKNLPASGGGAPLVIAAGTVTESISLASGSSSLGSFGTETSSMDLAAGSSLLSAGGESLSDGYTADAVGAATVGTDSLSGLTSIAGSSALPNFGTEALSTAPATRTGTATGYAGSAASTGTPGFTTPTNAQGAPNAASATITATQSGLNAATGSGVLTMQTYGLGVTPPGLTRTKVELIATELIKTTRAGLDLTGTMSAVLSLQKANGTGNFNVISSTNAAGTRNDASLVTDTVDITASVSSWTDAEIQGAKAIATANYNLAALGGSTFTWSIDSVGIRITYSGGSYS